MTDVPIKSIIEAALFVANKPLTIDHLLELFAEDKQPERSVIRISLRELRNDYAERGIELAQIASGYRFQTKAELTPWVRHLWATRPPRYSRALLETIAIIAYRQPITRSEIESIRGISVSTDLMKRLQDYNWIRILAHRDTPGRPALYGTTREFLNHFNLKNLNGLPTLAELKDMGEQLDIEVAAQTANEKIAVDKTVMEERLDSKESVQVAETTIVDTISKLVESAKNEVSQVAEILTSEEIKVGTIAELVKFAKDEVSNTININNVEEK